MDAPKTADLGELARRAYRLADLVGDLEDQARPPEPIITEAAFRLAEDLGKLSSRALLPPPKEETPEPDQRSVLDFFHVPSLLEQARALSSSITGEHKTSRAVGDDPSRVGALHVADEHARKVARILESIEEPPEEAAS